MATTGRTPSRDLTWWEELDLDWEVELILLDHGDRPGVSR